MNVRQLLNELVKYPNHTDVRFSVDPDVFIDEGLAAIGEVESVELNTLYLSKDGTEWKSLEDTALDDETTEQDIKENFDKMEAVFIRVKPA